MPTLKLPCTLHDGSKAVFKPKLGEFSITNSGPKNEDGSFPCAVALVKPLKFGYSESPYTLRGFWVWLGDAELEGPIEAQVVSPDQTLTLMP